MHVTLVTPLATLVGLCALAPALAVWERRRAAGRARRLLGLRSDPARRAGLAALASLAAAGTLVGLAAAQPVLELQGAREVRADAEVIVVLDVSRSMLARTGLLGETRIERAKALASALRAALPELRVGLASLTDRLLPHLFPTAAEDVFQATLERSLAVGRPPPRSSLSTVATQLEALRAARARGYFSPDARVRVLVVLTDGESLPVARARFASVLLRPPPVRPVFVHVWGRGERVVTQGAPEPGYRPDPGSRALLEGLAAATRGSVLGEADGDAIASAVRSLVGDGPTVLEPEIPRRHELAPYVALLAVVPVALFLARRER
jgi:hypothetical protein